MCGPAMAGAAGAVARWNRLPRDPANLPIKRGGPS
jgi:hypothetical protein